MNSEKLMVVFPGMGYHKDKPLLYYAWKLALEKGYDIQYVDYLEFFKGIKYFDAEMHEGALKAYERTKEILDRLDFSHYTRVVFVGKSFGTVMGAKYASERNLRPRQIWYTPVMDTYEYGVRDAIAFIGSKDPLSDVESMKAVAKEQGIALHVCEGGNHSLETGDVEHDLVTLQEVMKVTKEYL